VLAVLDSDDVDGGGLLGTVMVGHDGHRGWLYYLAVRADARRQGYGRALVRAAEDWVAARGIPKVQLMVRTGNTAAAGFYERLGYTDAGCIVLARRLDG
jgi:ribosomal protein S18 acetylase RimI-like enzyme